MTKGKRVSSRRLVFALLAIVMVLLSIAALPFVYNSFPELFGHYAFYRSCKRLEQGASLADVRAAMSQFLEVGRTFQPAAGIESQLFGATVPEVRENAREHASRIVFIPNRQERADWCIVYLNSSGTKVARIELAPD